MSFFKKSNAGKRTHHRKIEKNNISNNTGKEAEPISIRLGNIENFFSKGQWISRCNQNECVDEDASLKKCINELNEQNNLMKLKYEILMDMLLEQISSRR